MDEGGEPGTQARRLLEQRARRFARRAAEAELAQLKLIGFTRRGTRYAVGLEALLEIRPLKRFCPIPEASAVVPGVFYHRGTILSAHDIHPYLSAGAPATPAEWVLVCAIDGRAFGLLADVVSDVQEFPRDSLRPVPGSFGPRGENLRGLIGGGALVLDLVKLHLDDDFARGV